MNYLSVCSGIEAATVAWEHLGWTPIAFSEIEPFPCSVLAHHYPGVPNLGDFTMINREELRGTVDLVVGGTPCQAFSVAGLRRGLDDPRGNLTLQFLRLLEGIRPTWVVWENVPGILSIDQGRVFGAFLGGLAQLGYGFAYRVLDAQYFGVAQRRRRVFVVCHLGDWRRAAAVLFERESLCGHPAPRRGKREDATGTIEASLGRSRGAGTPAAACVAFGGNNCSGPIGPLTHGYRNKVGAMEVDCGLVLPVAFPANLSGTQCASAENVSPSMGEKNPTAVAFTTRGRADGLSVECQEELAYALKNPGNGGRANDRMVATAMQVRRLTPRECERLQGFPDDYTAIPWRNKPAEDCPDGPRYKALGNSMAVPCMRWIGERIAKVAMARREAA